MNLEKQKRVEECQEGEKKGERIKLVTKGKKIITKTKDKYEEAKKQRREEEEHEKEEKRKENR